MRDLIEYIRTELAQTSRVVSRFFVKIRRKVRMFIKKTSLLYFIAWVLLAGYIFILFGGALWVIIIENFF